MRSLSLVIHGESGAGKSWLAATAPEPRCILDTEGGGSRFTPSTKGKVLWDPNNRPPEPDGTWDTAIVIARTFRDVTKTYEWMQTGEHGFVSFIYDSLTEGQKRLVDDLVGTAQMKQQDWGTLLRNLDSSVRGYRDLLVHPTNPLQCVVYVAGTQWKDNRYRPHMQGQMALTLPYHVDTVGYLFVQQTDDGEGIMRRLMVQPVDPRYLAKDRTDALPPVIDNPNLVTMLDRIEAKYTRKEA